MHHEMQQSCHLSVSRLDSILVRFVDLHKTLKVIERLYDLQFLLELPLQDVLKVGLQYLDTAHK